MASKQTCREVAAVPPDRLPQRLSLFFADMACNNFDESRTPNTAPDEARVRDQLVTPLQWMLCGGDPSVSFCSLQEHQTQANFCGKVFRGGEPAYFCKDCQTDPTCCLCIECFEHSEHKDHNYRLFASGGGGCCDCGDPEAWTSFVHCDIHKPTEQSEQDVDPVEALPSDLVDRARPFFSSLLWYCMDMLCWEESNSLPPSLMQAHTAQCLQNPTSYLSFLYNDEEHSYDEVIFALTANLKKTHTDAIALATFVDRKGRAVCENGDENKCKQSKDTINMSLGSRKPLKVMVYHSAVASHQMCAILCLSLLKELSEKLDAFRRLISEALIQVRPQTGRCVLDSVFLNDYKMWITARLGWHRLVMSSIFMDMKCKPQLAVNLTNNYSELLKNFVADSHNHDVCASNMTVQLFTVPSLSRMLVKSHGLLEKIVTTLMDLVSPCKAPDSGLLKLTASSYNHNRVSYVMFDLRYVLRNKPESLADLREPVIQAFSKFIDLLAMVQNADPMKRQRVLHVEREQPWEVLFNFLIVLQQPIQQFIQWCISDREILMEAVRLTLRKHEQIAGRDKIPYKRHDVSTELVGKSKMELFFFDISKESVSIHQPLARVLAGLLTGASNHNLSLPQLLQLSLTDVQSPLFMMEMSVRVLVLAAQVTAGMWKRNGFSVFRQVATYQYHYPRGMMYDKDIVMLQAMAAVLDPTVFLYAIIHKFRLDHWIANPESDPSAKRGESSDDALRFFLSEAEELVFLLITIFCERYVVGVGEGVTELDSLRRELVHRLFISPLSHSQILKEFRMSERENEIDQLLKKVATLRKGGGMTKAVFVLRSDFEEDYNPFFYHYTRADHSMAEDAQRKRIKAAGTSLAPEAAAPASLPPFCPPFKNVIRLTTSRVIHRMLHCIFRQTSRPSSKFWSDRLLHEALYLCGVMLREEDSSQPTSLANAAIGLHGRNGFLEDLVSLLSSRRAEEHKPLLTWIIKILKKHREKSTGRSSPPNSTTSSIAVDGGGGEGGVKMAEQRMEAAAAEDRVMAERKEKAKRQREKTMAQMQDMQRRFLEKNRERMMDIVITDPDEVDTGPAVTVKSPTLRAVGLTVLMDRTPETGEGETCILCQARDNKDTSATPKKVFVQAVCVQRSCVLRQSSDISPTDAQELSTKCEYLTAKADPPLGMYTSGCGHHMHAECWKTFIETKQQEHGRRYFYPLPGQSVQWTSGEFLCPLCQSFSNSVLPQLPPICSPSSSSVSQPVQPQVNVGFSEWREIVDCAVELALTEGALEGNKPHPFWDKLSETFRDFKRPDRYYHSEKQNERGDMMSIFSQCVYMMAYKADPDESNERVCIAEWNNCAYTITNLEGNARRQGQSLLSSLSSRQVDYLGSLVKMALEPKLRAPVNKLGSIVRNIVNMFLLESSPFTENPSILEINAFSMMVYLHFSVMSLLSSLISSSGRLEDSPVLPAMIGLTGLHCVRTAAAARLLQFLLTSSSAMDTGSTVVDSSETDDGTQLQKLWITFRQKASLSHDCPPDGGSLVAGARSFLHSYLQSSVLFFQSLTGIKFSPPSSSSSEGSNVFSEMCTFLNIPHSLHTLLDHQPDVSSPRYSLRSLAAAWCSHSRLRQLGGVTGRMGGATSEVSDLPPILREPRRLISLPRSYSDLVNRASKFQCSNQVTEGGEDGQGAMLCLLCGEMLCTNSYCCQKEEEDDGSGRKPLRIGGLTRHARTCGDGRSMALWIVEVYVVLMDATDLHHVKGCTLTPPYLDEYGESDPGLRRGTPLILNEESYEQLQSIWYQHRIPEQITQEMETNRNLMGIVWSHM